MRIPRLAVAAAATALLWGEYVHWRASGRFLGTVAPTGAGRDAVVVLGYHNRGRTINAVNRARARAGLRSRETPETLMVFCGGPMGSPIPEAELLAAYATGVLGHRGPVAKDPTSRNTGENIAHAVPFLEDADRIRIVSNSIHAEIGRRYLWQQRPDLARRLVRGREYRFGDFIVTKPALAALGLWTIRRRFGRA